jgi:hypothetical protein
MVLILFRFCFRLISLTVIVTYLLSSSYAEDRMTIPKPMGFDFNKLAFFSVRHADVNFFQAEFGILGLKDYNKYKFNSYLGAFAISKHTRLKHVTSDTTQGSYENQPEKVINSAMLGLKGGFTLSDPFDKGFSVLANFGIGMTSVQSDAWFGKKDLAVDDSDVLILEYGLMYRHKKLVFRLIEMFTNLSYLERSTIISFGMNFR